MPYTTESNMLKLTKAQKDVVMKMREGWTLVYSIAYGYHCLECKDSDLKVVSKDTIRVLLRLRIIKEYCYLFSLTPLGRTIEI